MMIWMAVPIGFLLDLITGDPEGFFHPVILIGKLIDFLENKLRPTEQTNKDTEADTDTDTKASVGTRVNVFAGRNISAKEEAAGSDKEAIRDVVKKEKLAGALIWIITVTVSVVVPAIILLVAGKINLWIRILIEAIMCYQILATKSLRDAAMKVGNALKSGDIEKARNSVSMIVGRDTGRLTEEGIMKATVETIAENTSDGVIAPLFFMAIGGAAMGFMYKAVNTMDSMLGYTDSPYKNIGMIPAKMDDAFNFIPARISAGLMLIAGSILKLDAKNGIKIFKRDRYNHASPNSAQTESVMAGLLNARLAGDAYYHGILHKKPFIGDDIRKIEAEDIRTSCKVLYVTAILGLILSVIGRVIILTIVL